jgi:hypothetical protein
MPANVAIPAAIVLGMIFLTAALWPVFWLTRSPRAFGFRRVRRRTLLAWWIVAAIPWVVLLIVFRLVLNHRFSVSVHSIPGLIGIIAEALAIFVALVSLPLAVIVLTITWFLDRQPAFGVASRAGDGGPP